MLSRRKLAMAQYATLKVGDVKSQQIQNHSYGGEYSPPLMSNTQAAKLAWQFAGSFRATWRLYVFRGGEFPHQFPNHLGRLRPFRDEFQSSSLFADCSFWAFCRKAPSP